MCIPLDKVIEEVRGWNRCWHLSQTELCYLLFLQHFMESAKRRGCQREEVTMMRVIYTKLCRAICNQIYTQWRHCLFKALILRVIYPKLVMSSLKLVLMHCTCTGAEISHNIGSYLHRFQGRSGPKVQYQLIRQEQRVKNRCLMQSG